MCLGGDVYLVRESFRIRRVTARKWLKSSMLYKIMNPFRTGKLVLFQVSYDRDWHYFEIPFYILIGVFGVSRFREFSWQLVVDKLRAPDPVCRDYMALSSSNSTSKSLRSGVGT